MDGTGETIVDGIDGGGTFADVTDDGETIAGRSGN